MCITYMIIPYYKCSSKSSQDFLIMLKIDLLIINKINKNLLILIHI